MSCKRIYVCVVLIMSALIAWCNDGVFYVNGNHLVPIQETDIALTKEILTISLCDDCCAKVDVHYELMNHGKEKIVTMGFEADAPYNDDVAFSPQGIHPYISDFTVEMNSEKLSYMNAVVKAKYEGECDFQPLNLDVWKSYCEVKMNDGEDLPHNALLYNAAKDSLTDFAYAYYFVAHFNHGKNIIHHTYRYRMSYGVGRTFEGPYWLMPAMRWSNKLIDDFTLRIRVENTAKHFFVEDSLFGHSEFVITEGVGKIRKKRLYDEMFTEIALRNGTIEWHTMNFRPKANINIQSAERLHYDDFIIGTFYDRSDNYMPGGFQIDTDKVQDRRRILANLPYANRGYIFKDRKLQKYFSKFWWYMPDPNWNANTKDFTQREWRLINKGE